MEATLWTKVKPLLPSIIFPILSGSLIYADWRHTYLWKQSIAAQQVNEAE